MTDDTRIFAAPWEPKLWVMTAIAVVILLGAAALLLVGALQSLGAAPVTGVLKTIGAAVCIAGIVLFAVFAPRGYILGAQDIVISRFAGKIVLPLSDIAAVEVIPAGSPALRGVIRTLGVGGAFGYYGRFWNRHLGDFRAYITRTGPVVLLRRTSGVPVLISPDDVQAFAAAVEAALASPGAR